MAPPPARGDKEAEELISGAVARTRAARGARIEVEVGHRPLPDVKRSILVKFNPMFILARWVVRVGYEPRTEEGVIDFHNRRYMLFGGYAEVIYANGTSGAGRPGEPLSLRQSHRNATPVALWLWGLLGVITGAHEFGQETVRDVSCRMFAIGVDASRLPPIWGADADASGPVVWIGEDGYVHRIRVRAQERSFLIELWDFGSRVIDRDWSRLPTEQPAHGN